MIRRTSPDERARYDFLHEMGICAVTGRWGDIHVAHIRGADSLFNKPLTGTAIKPHFCWTLPLTPEKHRLQHEMGEEMFWGAHGYPWGSITEGPMAAALILEGFRTMDNIEGARAWLKERTKGR